MSEISRSTFLAGLGALTIMGINDSSAEAAVPPPAPSGLMCDLLAHPERVALTNPQPCFTWIVNSRERDDLQTAFQVRVAEEPGPNIKGEAVAIWDSGKVVSGKSVSVPYEGKALQSNREYSWRVRTWDRKGNSSDWSEAQRFRTGNLGTGLYDVASDGEKGTVARYPLVQTTVEPAAIVTVAPGHYFLDFARDGFAGLKLTLTAAADGETVSVALGEVLASTSQINPKPGGSRRYHRTMLALKAGIHTYDVPLGSKDDRRMPPEIGAVMPYRYVEIEGYVHLLTKADAQQTVAHYPFDDNAVHFSSSNESLNRVWELCRYTMKATSFCGIYVDGDRERLPYEADTLINQLGHYSVDREFTLARHSHEHLIQKPTWPTEWFLQSVLIAYTDYLYTGDGRSLWAFYNDLTAKTLLPLARPDGLISTTVPLVPLDIANSVHHTPPTRRIEDIVDWPPSERDGYEMKPVNTVVNAFYGKALRDMSLIAHALNKTEDAARFEAAFDRASHALNEKLFDPATGLYVDGEGSTHSSLHANMFPLALGLVPADRIPKVAAFVKSRGMACSVYGAQFLMEALYRGQLADHALALMLAPGDRSWRHMAEDVGTTMTLEAWDDKYKPNEDWNHAWGAAPANIIPRFLMGIEPTSPGFRTLRIAPQPGGLATATIDLPTIRGTVHVDFKRNAAGLTINIHTPANTVAEVRLRVTEVGESDVLVDGQPRRARRDGGWLVLENIGSGSHTFALKFP